MNNPGSAGPVCLLIALAILFLLPAPRAYAGDVLLTTQQAFGLDRNTTLVIEDTDSPQGVIWLKLYSRNETVDSAVIGLGEHLSYAGKNITLYKIYSGSDIDLVALEIENETTRSSKGYDKASTTNMTHNIDSIANPLAHTLLVHASDSSTITNTTNNILFNRSDKQIIGQNAS